MADLSDLDRRLSELPQRQRVDGRQPDGKFAKGLAPAGPGRPKGVSTIVRELTGEGQEPVDVLLAIMRDKLLDGEGERQPVPVRLRKEAAETLLDRGWGKPTQPVEVNEREIDAAIEAELARLAVLESSKEESLH